MCERRLGYLVKVSNSLFSYGLPSSGSKLPLKYSKGEVTSQYAVQTRYDDLTIISRIILLMKHVNQLRQHNKEYEVDIDLELALVQAICMFKSSVLGDPRLLLMGANALDMANGNKKGSDDDTAEENAIVAHEYVKMDTETQKSYNSLAQMMENGDMRSIMTIFAEKMLMNLVYSKNNDNSKRIINITLDTLSFYSGALSSCRMLANTEVMQQIIKGGLQNFEILQHVSQMKMLGQFYRIMLQLWLNDDYISVFEQNIS